MRIKEFTAIGLGIFLLFNTCVCSVAAGTQPYLTEEGVTEKTTETATEETTEIITEETTETTTAEIIETTTEKTTETTTEETTETTTEETTETTTEETTETTTEESTETTTAKIIETTTEETTAVTTETTTAVTTETTTTVATETTTIADAATETTTTETTTKKHSSNSNNSGGGIFSNSLHNLAVNESSTTAVTEATTEATTAAYISRIDLSVGSQWVSVNGVKKLTELEPFIQKQTDSMLIPIRMLEYVFSNNITYSWNAEKKIATVKYKDKVVKIVPGSKFTLVNNKPLANSNGAYAEIVNDRICIPVRTFAKALGFHVQWDKNTNTATYIVQ